MASASSQKTSKNRLGKEKSPYLLQHANNPVDWYPWGQEAFDKAKAENKPIFLSVGYSTCHWCHVMERESFENEGIGKLLNDDFVCIKVDREERPDVDRVYMSFIQATSGGGGGWPMSVWMTPDLKPFAGGTYFPPDDRYHGRPGFKTVLQRISEKWKNFKPGIEEQGSSVLDALLKHNTAVAVSSDIPNSEASSNRCYSQLEKSYEPEMGGFGKAPKFPQPVNFNFMMRVYANNKKSPEGINALAMTLHTLKMMAKGGMYDHVAKGFHRYSTDDEWHVPHFEKMLYDQGQLAVAYAEAYQATHDEDLAAVAKGILEYCCRDLSHPEGGFYSAEDADSLPTYNSTDKKEGAFCVWTDEEVRTLLAEPVEGKDGLILADVFCHHFDVQKNGNVDPYKDPHDELTKQNVLIVRESIEETADIFGLEIFTVNELLDKAKCILFDARKNRPPPHLDNKMITAWNGLMISGCAKVSQSLADDTYASRASETVKFLRNHMYNADSGKLLRSAYVGENKEIVQIPIPIEAFVDDYSFLIQGLLDLYETTFDQSLLEWAEELQNKQDELFWDSQDGGYYSNSGLDPSIVMRLKEDQDGAEPSANSVSANNLLRLACFLDKPELQEKAGNLFKVFGERLKKIPLALPKMVCGLMFYHSTPKQIIIRGDLNSSDTKDLITCVQSLFLPHKVLILDDGRQDSFLYKKLQVLSSLEMKDGKATAYVCENYTCSLPVNTVDELKQMLSP